jgi:PRC-barrel domain protein
MALIRTTNSFSSSTLTDQEEAVLQSSNHGREGDASRSETRTLIAASKVEGTAVYNRQGEALGSVYDVMIDKRSGDAAYAVMSFGGFLGIGKSYHPVPWNILDYDESQSGYVVDVNKEMLEKAPTYAQGQEPNWADHSYVRQIDDYYGSSHRSL